MAPVFILIDLNSYCFGPSPIQTPWDMHRDIDEGHQVKDVLVEERNMGEAFFLVLCSGPGS